MLLPSPQEHLHAWLRSLDAEAEGLTPRFTAALRRALAHYGIDSLERTPRLEEACYRLFLSQQRAEIARTAIVAILDRRLEDADELVGHVVTRNSATSSTGSRSRSRGATRSSPIWPARSASATSTSR